MAKPYLRGEMYYSNLWFMGKRIRKPLSPNKRTAISMQDEMASANRYRRNGLIPEIINLEVFETQYLKLRLGQRPNTYAHDRLAFKRLREIFPYLKTLSEITPELLLQAQIKWKEEGYGSAAIGSYVMRWKVAMKMAEKMRYILPQSWNIVKDFVSPGRLIYYTKEQYLDLLTKTQEPFTTALMLMTLTGLRSGEARHLEWSDINFVDHTVYIHPKPFWKPKGWKPNKPKARFIDMPEGLEQHLQALPSHQGFVLGPKIINEGAYSRYFTNLVQGASLRGSAHAFRHTYATFLISAGCTLEEIGELMGHDNPMTTKIYAHLMPHARRRAVDRLQSFVAVL